MLMEHVMQYECVKAVQTCDSPELEYNGGNCALVSEPGRRRGVSTSCMVRSIGYDVDLFRLRAEKNRRNAHKKEDHEHPQRWEKS